MYRAKHARRSYRLYDAAEDPHSPERLQLASDLRHAVEAGGLVAHFQPKVGLRDGRIEGMEVLMRWPHPQRGMISPDEFIPLAEDGGLIVPLTTIALEAAMRECRVWRDAGIDIRFAVNVSARSLMDSRIVDEVRELLARWQIPGSLLQLELTESTVVEDLAGAHGVLLRLREMGVSFALDDFGTGWSSLGQLNDLPFDELKIDRSFVLAMRPGAPEDAIVRSTIQLARELGLRVVAEGVEDDATRKRLADLGCDAAQGFLFARPGPAGAVAARRRARAAAGSPRVVRPPRRVTGFAVRTPVASRKVPPMESGGGTSEEAPGAGGTSPAAPPDPAQIVKTNQWAGPAGARGAHRRAGRRHRLRLSESRRGGAEVLLHDVPGGPRVGQRAGLVAGAGAGARRIARRARDQQPAGDRRAQAGRGLQDRWRPRDAGRDARRDPRVARDAVLRLRARSRGTADRDRQRPGGDRRCGCSSATPRCRRPW